MVVAVEDPDEKVAGRGIRQLQEVLHTTPPILYIPPSPAISFGLSPCITVTTLPQRFHLSIVSDLVALRVLKSFLRNRPNGCNGQKQCFWGWGVVHQGSVRPYPFGVVISASLAVHNPVTMWHSAWDSDVPMACS